ncbi:MAG: hypothetical protein LBM71_06075 [Elusimicrobiota bacterium]|jgi:hypothetical protein|nr:hypothetical protein [Elusimicrobiota bacterium]
MDKKKDSQTFFLHIMLVLFLTLLIAYPVTLFVKKASNMEAAITDEQAASFVLDTVEVKNFDDPFSDGRPVAGTSPQTRYNTSGQAILAVNVYNIARLTQKDFENVGLTPWSLINTVKANLQTPQVIDIVFNNTDVIKSFLNRSDTQDILLDYHKLSDMLSSKDYAIERFIKNPTVQAVLQDDAVFKVLSTSKLIDQILMSPTAQYFIKNPQTAKTLAQDNPALKEFLDNEKVKAALLENRRTAAAAKIFYK